MAHQCVIIILSLPLNVSCFPPIPAILASRDCANVNVTLGRPSLISISSSKIEVRKLGGFAMRLQRSRFNVQRSTFKTQRTVGVDTAKVLVDLDSANRAVRAVQSRDDFLVYIWAACGNEQPALALQPPPSTRSTKPNTLPKFN